MEAKQTASQGTDYYFADPTSLVSIADSQTGKHKKCSRCGTFKGRGRKCGDPVLAGFGPADRQCHRAGERTDRLQLFVCMVWAASKRVQHPTLAGIGKVSCRILHFLLPAGAGGGPMFEISLKRAI